MRRRKGIKKGEKGRGGKSVEREGMRV